MWHVRGDKGHRRAERSGWGVSGGPERPQGGGGGGSGQRERGRGRGAGSEIPKEQTALGAWPLRTCRPSPAGGRGINPGQLGGGRVPVYLGGAVRWCRWAGGRSGGEGGAGLTSPPSKMRETEGWVGGTRELQEVTLEYRGGPWGHVLTRGQRLRLTEGNRGVEAAVKRRWGYEPRVLAKARKQILWGLRAPRCREPEPQNCESVLLLDPPGPWAAYRMANADTPVQRGC